MKSLVVALGLLILPATTQAATVHGAVAATAKHGYHVAAVSAKDAAKVGSYPVRHPKKTAKGVVKGVVVSVKHL